MQGEERARSQRRRGFRKLQESSQVGFTDLGVDNELKVVGNVDSSVERAIMSDGSSQNRESSWERSQTRRRNDKKASTMSISEALTKRDFKIVAKNLSPVLQRNQLRNEAQQFAGEGNQISFAAIPTDQQTAGVL